MAGAMNMQEEFNMDKTSHYEKMACRRGFHFEMSSCVRSLNLRNVELLMARKCNIIGVQWFSPARGQISARSVMEEIEGQAGLLFTLRGFVQPP